MVNDFSEPEANRTNAARAIYYLQEAGADTETVRRVWSEILVGDINKVNEGLALYAIRGLGLLRDRESVDRVLPYLTHPAPLIRGATAIALGRIGDRRVAPPLMELLDPAETNENVRLFARKALQALAGGVDRGENIKEWQRLFADSGGG
jgi:HEAT repeat protein